MTEELQEDEPVVQDWENYLDRLQILLLAYALAGVHPLSSAPAAAQELTFGADTTEFVEAPLDVLMEDFHRAKRTTCLLSMGRRLQWLQARDAEERALWVQKYRCGTRTWLHVGHTSSADGTTAPSKVPPVSSVESPGRPSKFQLGKPVKTAGKVARVMRDGTKLCELWQTGQCKKGKSQHERSIDLTLDIRQSFELILAV